MNLEERLRATLTDPQRTLPAWPDPVARVRVGIRARRRRRSVAFAAAMVAVGVLALPALLRVQLADAPRPEGPASPTSSGPPGTVRATDAACTAGNLTAVIESGEQPDRAMLVVTNTGSRRCTLDGWPTLITVQGGAAQVVPLVPTPADAVADHETPATIDPMEPAYAVIVASTSCHGGQNPATYANVSLTLSGGQLPVAGPTLMATCPIQIGPWYRRIEKG
jgi:hypothetical protein